MGKRSEVNVLHELIYDLCLSVSLSVSLSLSFSLRPTRGLLAAVQSTCLPAFRGVDCPPSCLRSLRHLRAAALPWATEPQDCDCDEETSLVARGACHNMTNNLKRLCFESDGSQRTNRGERGEEERETIVKEAEEEEKKDTAAKGERGYSHREQVRNSKVAFDF